MYSHYHYYIASAHKMIGYRSYTLILLVSSPLWLTFPIFFLIKNLYVAYWNPNLGWLNLQIDTYSSWFPIFSLLKLMASHQCLPFSKGKQSHFCWYLTVQPQSFHALMCFKVPDWRATARALPSVASSTSRPKVMAGFYTVKHGGLKLPKMVVVMVVMVVMMVMVVMVRLQNQKYGSIMFYIHSIHTKQILYI